MRMKSYDGFFSGLRVVAHGAAAWRRSRAARAADGDRPESGVHDAAQLEHLAMCACSGYFHGGDVAAPFVFVSEKWLRD
jgi:hypothetical protein